jgi:hypothetical protein
MQPTTRTEPLHLSAAEWRMARNDLHCSGEIKLLARCEIKLLPRADRRALNATNGRPCARLGRDMSPRRRGRNQLPHRTRPSGPQGFLGQRWSAVDVFDDDPDPLLDGRAPRGANAGSNASDAPDSG